MINIKIERTMDWDGGMLTHPFGVRIENDKDEVFDYLAQWAEETGISMQHGIVINAVFFKTNEERTMFLISHGRQ